MTARIRRSAQPSAFLRNEDGATLVEFSIVISLFLLILFGLIDFGRLAYHLVTAERAMHAAARIAAVRPPACPGVPEFLTRHRSAPSGTDYGDSCGSGTICADPGTFTCVGVDTSPTAADIWAQIGGVVPGDSGIENLQFTYSYDARMGFLGGPYVPVVTVELVDVTFEFVTPLSALAVVAGAAPGGTVGDPINFPGMSVSLPGEDLAQGENG